MGNCLKRAGIALGILLVQLWIGGMSVTAGTLWESPYVKFSPDHTAWTLEQKLPGGSGGGLPAYWYPYGRTVHTGRMSSLRLPEEGEHYYGVSRGGEVPVGYWQVSHTYAACIHRLPSYLEEFCGITFGRSPCGHPYFSGWQAYCADCGGCISPGLVYGSMEAMATIGLLDTEMKMYYLCPSCNHLEQGRDLGTHSCRQISANRYRVVYSANTVRHNGDCIGEMADSFHMYNNETSFEGRDVTANTHLNQNGFQRTGYRFREWNTEPDGGGTAYEDGAEIYNLSSENYDLKRGTGTVTLYAQWDRVETNLIIDPNGGSYLGESGKTVFRQEYGSSYRLQTEELNPPEGCFVSFDAAGGTQTAGIRSKKFFEEWCLLEPAAGGLENGTYTFRGEMEDTDTVKALYVHEPILLPSPVRTGYSFGGWYREPQCVELAGYGGDFYIPSEDETLYAAWVELTLRAENNYTANGGRGAVDLFWSQPDGKNKTYKLYQSLNGVDFYQIYDAKEAASEAVDGAYGYTGRSRTITVPHTGFYELTASGAQGGGCGSSAGGRGGSVTGKFYLTRGERLTISAGGQNGFHGGGRGFVCGNGGGFTSISSDLKGTLLIGGGGGGATLLTAGGSGGTENGLLDWRGTFSGEEGENGAAGGGGGLQGGRSGQYQESRLSQNQGYRVVHNQDMDSNNYAGCGYRWLSDSSCSFYLDSGWKEDGGADSGNASLQLYKTVSTKGAKYLDVSVSAFGCSASTVVIGYKDGRGTYLGQGRSDVSGYDSVSLAVSGSIRIGGVGSVEAVLTINKFELTSASAAPSYGGSNYVNTATAVIYAGESGSREGNGLAEISSLQVGFQNGMELLAEALDLAPPEKIDADSVKKAPLGKTAVTVTFAEPEDNGTVYYHRADSFVQETEVPLCTSNITKNKLTSGISGYYYRADEKTKTEVSPENADNAGKPEKNPCLIVPFGEGTKYLHVAAADVAGNVSETIHIRLDGADLAWDLCTEMLQIGSVINGKDGKNVAKSLDKSVWYARADGSTPFLLSFDSSLLGEARENYQINYAVLNARIETSQKMQSHITKLPYTVPLDVNDPLNSGDFVQKTEGDLILGDGMYNRAVRREGARTLRFERAFTLDSRLHGEKIEITPGVCADFGEKIICSDSKEDAANALVIVADGEGPMISGLDSMEGLVVEWKGQTLELILSAWDGLSGVEEFIVTVNNQDNFGEAVYRPGEDGVIRLTMSEEDSLFLGSFTVTACAADRVGNVTEQTYGATGFAMETRVERILEPREPVFKQGESGILFINTYGYADRVEVQFPEELAALNPDLNQTFLYEIPRYEQEEKLEFMIPLYAPENRYYEIKVRAFKGDRKLEKSPAISVIGVQGSVLDELRTRLR